MTTCNFELSFELKLFQKIFNMMLAFSSKTSKHNFLKLNTVVKLV